MNVELVKFENVELSIFKSEQHEWLLDNELVAQGYGVSSSNIRMAKKRHLDELIEGVHFLTETTAVTNCYSKEKISLGGVMDLKAYNFGRTKSRKEPKTFWTKKGVIKLGFFLRSNRAKEFRTFAENLILTVAQQNVTGMQIDGAKWTELENKINRLTASTIGTEVNEFTIHGYCGLNKIKVSYNEAQALGKLASKKCREVKEPTGKIRDSRFGTVNIYPEHVLKITFEEFFKKPRF